MRNFAQRLLLGKVSSGKLEAENSNQQEQQEIILDVENKIIYIDGEIKEDTYRTFSACADEIINSYEGEVDEITIEINTNGGSIHSSYMMIEKVEQLKSQGIKVVMNAGEFCMSGGCALFLYGSERNIRKYSQLMFHSAWIPGVESVNFADLISYEKRLNIYWYALEDTLQKCTKLTKEEIENIKRNPLDYYLDCYEAIEKGFADNIL